MSKNCVNKQAVNPKEFLSWRINNLLVGLVYTSLFSRFIKNFGSGEEIKTRLHNIGKRTAELVFDIYKYKGKNFSNILKYISYHHWGCHMIINTIEKDSIYELTTKECMFCKSIGTTIEGIKDVHYCEPTSGFIEELYNLIAGAKPKLKFKKIKVSTIDSLVAGSSDCKYKVEIIELKK